MCDYFSKFLLCECENDFVRYLDRQYLVSFSVFHFNMLNYTRSGHCPASLLAVLHLPAEIAVALTGA